MSLQDSNRQDSNFPQDRNHQGFAWIFTWNNPSVSQPDFELQLQSHCVWYAFQLESGENGTPHFQGYLQCKTSTRLSTLKRRFAQQIHWEPRRGTHEEALAYVTKNETRIGGPWIWGTPRQTAQGKRTDLTAAIETLRTGGLRQLREVHGETYVKFHAGLTKLANATLIPREEPPEVHLLFGPTGCGKTRAFYDRFGADAYSVPLTDGLWFDGYEGQESCLIDDFDGRASKMPLRHLLRLLDRYTIRIPVKGGFVNFCPTYIYVTTNFHPRDWYDWSGREQQYPALKRRFSTVHWWSSGPHDGVVSSGPSGPRTFGPSDELWDYFWAGRQAQQDVIDLEETAQTGRIVSRTSDADYFNF